MVAVAAIALLWKAWWLADDAFPFSADEAVVGLMARHILAGARPAFFYGQAYLGSLDAYFIAGAFRALGESVLAIRVAQSILYAGTVATTALLARRLLGPGPPPLVAGLLMALPAVSVTLYTTVSLGGYGEAILIGNVLLLLACSLRTSAPRPGLAGVWGLLGGVGFWTFGLTLVYLVPSAVMLGITWLRGRGLPRRGMAGVLAVSGFLIGASPWWWSALTGGVAAQVTELLGSAISGATSANPITALLIHVANLALFGPTVVLGIRPPWSTEPLAMPLLPIALAFWLYVFYHSLSPKADRRMRPEGRRLLLGVVACVCLGFVLTPFGADPSGRYFLPMAAPLALLAADALERIRDRKPRIAAPALLLAVLAFHGWGTLQSAHVDPPRITTQFDSSTWIDRAADEELISFLLREGETRGYSTYWVSYPIAFLSQEKLIFAPHLPYHDDLRYTSRDDRYPPYRQAVRQSAQAAYITANNPTLEEVLRNGFLRLGLAWHEQRIGDYTVFYALPRKVEPGELGLGPDGP